MKRIGRLGALLLLLGAAPALAHEAKVAVTPQGGVSWDILHQTDAQEWQDGSSRHLRPVFTPAVEALDGRPATVAGFMMVVDGNSKTSDHILLFEAEPDCIFHMVAGPTGFIDVRLAQPIRPVSGPIQLTGTLRLVRAQKGGIFYRLENAARVAAAAGAADTGPGQ